MRAIIQRLNEAYYKGTQGRLSRAEYLAAEQEAHAQAAALGYGIRVYGRFPTCQCLSYFRLDSRWTPDCSQCPPLKLLRIGLATHECMETGKRPVSLSVQAFSGLEMSQDKKSPGEPGEEAVG